mgnify:CR=1 FL=1
MGFLDLLLGRRHASLIGLDINSSGAKLVELGQTASGEYIVERFASENFEKGWINDGTIEKFDEVAEAVQRLVQRSGTRTKQVAMAMPQSAVITKKIVLPGGLTEEEMELQVEAEAHQYIPFPLDDVSLDFCVIGPSTEQVGDVEVMLAASYGLLLHGSGRTRIQAGLHYIAINLAASSLFLVGVSMLYGITGTLNMADLARAIPLVAPGDRGLLHSALGILATAFLIKAAVWPLNFWLVPAYSAATAPVGALFALMTKVGVYTLLRLWTLMFSSSAGASALFGGQWLMVGGMVTMLVGAIGMLAATRLTYLAGYAAITSSGTLLAATGFGEPALLAGLLYYLPSSTMAGFLTTAGAMGWMGSCAPCAWAGMDMKAAAATKAATRGRRVFFIVWFQTLVCECLARSQGLAPANCPVLPRHLLRGLDSVQMASPLQRIL